MPSASSFIHSFNLNYNRSSFRVHERRRSLARQPRVLIAAGGGGGGKSSDSSSSSSPIDKLRELSKDAIQKKAAQESQLGELQTKLTAALRDLEVAQHEAAAARDLRQEIEARAAAMTNLQAQLDQVENLRAQELQASVKRFEELESALTLAETSMGAQAKRVTELETRLVAMAKELEGAAQQADVLRTHTKEAGEKGVAGGASPAEAARVVELEKQLASSRSLEAGLRLELSAAAESTKSLNAQIDRLNSALEQKEAELKSARRLSEEVAKAAEASEAELRTVHAQLATARQLETQAAARAQEMEVLARKESAACAEMLQTAEALAAMMAQRLAAVEDSIQRDGTASDDSDTEYYSSGEEGDAEIESRKAALGALTEADVEAVLDEIEYLRGELSAELQASEELAERVEASEAEAAGLRKQLAAMAAAGDENTTTMGGFSQTLVQELATSRAAAAAAAGEVESLKVTNAALAEEVKRLREEAQQAQRGSMAAAMPGRFGTGGNKELAAALTKVAQLEQQNAELRETAIAREAALAEGRAFLRSYLERAVNSETSSAGSGASATTTTTK